jgi:hypothetical protein
LTKAAIDVLRRRTQPGPIECYFSVRLVKGNAHSMENPNFAAGASGNGG